MAELVPLLVEATVGRVVARLVMAQTETESFAESQTVVVFGTEHLRRSTVQVRPRMAGNFLILETFFLCFKDELEIVLELVFQLDND